MRFEQLRYLEAAVRTGSFRQAARELGVSQPTITNQIQRLEEDLGVVLMFRGSRGATPTEAAERMLPHVTAAIRAEDMLRQEASAMETLKVGNVRLVTVATGSSVLLPPVIRQMHDQHPNIRFDVNEGGSESVLKGVARGTYDIGLAVRIEALEQPDEYEHLQVIELLTGRLVLCVPDSHPLSESEDFQFSDLDDEPLVFMGQGSILRTAMERLMEGFEARVVYTAHNAETAQHMVRAGVGISIANSLALSTRSGDGVTLIPINEPWARTKLVAVLRKDEHRSPVVQTLLRLIKKNAEAHSGARPSPML
ncbi:MULTISPECIES: LysR family transcriptional regulator [Aeromicrobium]|uniref:LysR family transcriptional regulator n=1 Tax=Aeromicrobium TaxID=2040 RepID=UPI00257EA11A|nr:MULTISPECIES: LysR family transcriptional regulator [Aeromicrobium]